MELIPPEKCIITSRFSETKAKLYQKPKDEEDINFDTVFCSHTRSHCGIQPDVITPDKIQTKQSRDSHGRKYFVIVRFNKKDEEKFFNSDLVNRLFSVAYYDDKEDRIYVVLNFNVKAPLFWEWFHEKMGRPGFKVFDWREEKKSLDTLLSLGYKKYRTYRSDGKLTTEEDKEYKGITLPPHNHELDRDIYDYHDRLKLAVKRGTSRNNSKKNLSYKMETEESEENSLSEEKPQPKRKATVKPSFKKEGKQAKKLKGDKRAKSDQLNSSDSESNSSDSDSSIDNDDDRKSLSDINEENHENTSEEEGTQAKKSKKNKNKNKKNKKKIVGKNDRNHKNNNNNNKKAVKKEQDLEMDSDSDSESDYRRSRRERKQRRKNRDLSPTNNGSRQFVIMDPGFAQKELFTAEGIPIKFRRKKYVRPVDDAKNEDLLAYCHTLFLSNAMSEKCSQKTISESIIRLDLDPIFKGRLLAYVGQHFNELVAIISPYHLKTLVLENNSEGDIIWSINAESYFSEQRRKRNEPSVKIEDSSDPTFITPKTAPKLNGYLDSSKNPPDISSNVKIEESSHSSDPFTQMIIESGHANLPDMTEMKFSSSQENLINSLDNITNPKAIARAIHQRHQTEEEEDDDDEDDDDEEEEEKKNVPGEPEKKIEPPPPQQQQPEPTGKTTPIVTTPLRREPESGLKEKQAETVLEPEPVPVPVTVQTPTPSSTKKRGRQKKETKSAQPATPVADKSTPTVIPPTEPVQELLFDLRAVGKEEGIKLSMPSDSTVLQLFVQVKELTENAGEIEINYKSAWIEQETKADLVKKLSQIFASEKPGRAIKLWFGPKSTSK